DRPDYPYGSLEYITHLKDIFSSPLSPLWQFLHDQKIVTKEMGLEEGYTYIGVVTILISFVIFIALIINIFRRPGSKVVLAEGFDRIWVFVAACAIIMAMGIPFIWKLEWLIDY